MNEILTKETVKEIQKEHGKLIKLQLRDIRAYENNTKLHTPEQIDKIRDSIQEFGYNDLIEVDENNIILAGHGRLRALYQLDSSGGKSINIWQIDGLTESQKKAYRIAHNKLNMETGFDNVKLSGEFNSLEDTDNFNDTGFSNKEITEIWEEVDPAKAVEDNFEEPKEAKYKITKGEIWQLGEHRLMCGDSTSKEDVDSLMNGQKADMVFTDPPYGIDYSGGRTQVVKDKNYGKLMNDDLQGEELGGLIKQVFNFSSDIADHYICVSPIMQKPFLDFIESSGKSINAVIVWDKKQPGLGYMSYRRQCEFILFIKGNQFRKGDNSDFDLWQISRDNGQDYVHGTQKPIGVPARAINNSSKQDNTVLDLFGGSGSTLIACEQLNRKCYMMELDEYYCSIIIERWEKLTGKQGVKLEND